MPDGEERSKYADRRILRKAGRRRKRYSKETTGEQSEKLKSGVGRRQYALETKGKGRTKSYYVGGQLSKKVKDDPEPEDTELEHKKTGEKEAGVVEEVFKGKGKDYDPKDHPEGEEGEAEAKSKFEKAETGKTVGQEFQTEGEKPTKSSLATRTGYKDPDVLTKTRTSGPGLTSYKGGRGRRRRKVETGRTRGVVKTKTFTREKPTKDQVRAKEIMAKQAREKDLQKKSKEKGRDLEIQSVGKAGRSKIKYKTGDMNPTTGEPSRYYTTTTEKFKGKGRKMKTVVREKRRRYRAKDE